MSIYLRCSFAPLIAALIGICFAWPCDADQREYVEEHLVLHDISDGAFALTTAIALHGSASLHHTRFPRALSTLFDSFPVQQLKLTLTRGRWREDWGVGIGPVPPPGATLEVTWHDVVEQDQIPSLWQGTTNAVSGLFCTSLNALAPSTAYIAQTPLTPWTPSHAPCSVEEALQQLMSPMTEHLTTYGVLSQEALCTENLAAIAKLLPCGNSAGVMQLLQPNVFLSAPFHSIALDLTGDSKGGITALIRVSAALRHPGAPSVADVLQQPPHLHHCPAASATTMTIVNHHNRFDVGHLIGDQSPWQCMPLNSVSSVSVCQLPTHKKPSSTLAPLQVLLQPGSHSKPTESVGVPLLASQQLLGAGGESGTFLLELQRGHLSGAGGGGLALLSDASHPKLIVCSRTTLPWFLRPWIHTLTATVDGVKTSLQKLAFWTRIDPGLDRVRMHVIEFCFEMQPVWSVVTMSLEIGKTLLYLEEYPPDAHRGFDISPTRIYVAQADSKGRQPVQQGCWEDAKHAYYQSSENAVVAEWLAVITCRAEHDIHTANVVTTLATPDFSMPYVVCSLTSSLLAIFSGLFFTLLTERRRTVALRQLQRAKSKWARLKPVLILLLFAVLVPYMDPEWRDWVVNQLQGVGFSKHMLKMLGLVPDV